MRRLLGVALAATLVLGGCLVRRSTYEGEQARGRVLEEKLAERDTRIQTLDRRIRDLSKAKETLELERGSLSEERVALLNDLEDLREGNSGLRDEIARERETRKSREVEITEISGSYRGLVEALEAEVQSGQLEIHRLKGRLQVRALDRVLFASGSAQLKPEGEALLAKLAAQLSGLAGHRVRIEGHTDDVPIRSARFPSNWELSAARAAGVARLLVQHGLAPEKVAAVGYGPHHPVDETDTREGRARNRRIEIVLVPDDED